MWFRLSALSPGIISLDSFINVLFIYQLPGYGKWRWKKLIKGSTNKSTWLGKTCPICLLTKLTKTPRGHNIDVPMFAPWFMLQMDFPFFHVESICAFTSTFLAVCFPTSYPFGFPYRNKQPNLDILRFLANTLSNQNKKV